MTLPPASQPKIGDGGDGSSAVPKTGSNIPNTVPAAAEFRKAARGSPAEDS